MSPDSTYGPGSGTTLTPSAYILIAGTVIDFDDQGVPNAMVRVYRRDTGALVSSTVTEWNGPF